MSGIVNLVKSSWLEDYRLEGQHVVVVILNGYAVKQASKYF